MWRDEIFEFTKGLAREAGELVRRERKQGISRGFKNGRELVTSADTNADRLISERIRARFPGHRIISEELAPEYGWVEADAHDLWIVDPIDGTVNFAHGHNQSAVCIAYIDQGDIVCGVVYNPFTDEMFCAAKGGGAFLNGDPISCSKETELRLALIATGFPYTKVEIEILYRRVQVILNHCADIRRLGSAALDICWVAMGRLDGFYESLSLWDFAAAQIIAREAGATYGHFHPVPEGIPPQFHGQNILVANPRLFPQLKALLSAVDYPDG